MSAQRVNYGPPPEHRPFISHHGHKDDQFDEWERSWAEHLGVEPEAASAQEAKEKRGEADPYEGDPERKARFQQAVAYIAAYRGSWGLILDLRLAPPQGKWGTKWFRLTDRQVEVILAAKARDAERVVAPKHPRHDEAVAFAKAHPESSFLASIAAQAATRSLSDKQVEAVLRSVDREPAQTAPRPTRVTEDGMYQHPETKEVYKVQEAREGSGRLYAKRLVVTGEGAEFVYEHGLVNRIRPEWRMSLEDAKAFGQLYGVCCVCSRPLTDEKSIAAGIGPICIGRI